MGRFFAKKMNEKRDADGCSKRYAGVYFLVLHNSRNHFFLIFRADKKSPKSENAKRLIVSLLGVIIFGCIPLLLYFVSWKLSARFAFCFNRTMVILWEIIHSVLLAKEEGLLLFGVGIGLGVSLPVLSINFPCFMVLGMCFSKK